MSKLRRTLVLAGILPVVLSSAAYAAIVSTSGDVVQIPPPASVEFGQLEDDDFAFAFDEQQGVTLTADVPCDITSPGLYDDVAVLTPGVVPAGTVVDGHFVHSDNVGQGGGGHQYDGDVVVDADILCIQVLGPTLHTGDPQVGWPGTTYPTGDDQRGLELGERDDLVIEQADERTVTVHLETFAHADQVRIITPGEPGNGNGNGDGGEGCTPGFWKQEQHFDSWTDPYDPPDPFSDHFEDAFPGKTLLDVLQEGGGQLDALGRHTVAAVLNAAHPNVDYAFDEQEVIDEFNDVFPGSNEDYENLKNQFEAENESGCPLNNEVTTIRLFKN